MKYLVRLFSLVLFACIVPLAHAADLSGVWKGSFDFNDQTVVTTIKLTVAGDAVTGTVEGLPTSPAAIHDGKLTGSTLSFWVNTEYGAQTYKLVFTGKVKDESIEFNFGTDDGSWGSDLSVKRDAPAVTDVTGTWKGSFDLFGSDTPIAFNLKSAGGVVTGAVLNADGKSNEIHDGKLVGDTVSFWVNTEYQGQSYTVEYKGKIHGGTIEFNFGIPDGSWGASTTVKKS